MIGDFPANGVIGLAPTKDLETNFIEMLQSQGVIKNKVVGINLENPLDTNQKSRISIGQIDYNEVEGGVNGLNYYNNRAVGKWGLQMDDFLYDDIDMTALAGAKIGLIDSGNTSIQVPNKIFENIKLAMKMHERSIYESNVDGRTILVARKSCEDLAKKLKPIEFALQNTKIVIQPRGYLYHLQGQSDCFIGIESIPDRTNQYRLGTVFLRNFYTALDYDQNLIIIGVNKGSSDSAKAELIGKIYNPFKHIKNKGGAMAAVLICLLCLFSVAIAFFVKAKKEQAEVNNGAPVSSSSSGKKQNYKFQNDDLDKSLNEAEAESLDDA